MGEGPFRILIVEDNEPDVFMVREALQQAGLEFQLQALDDGEKAVDLIAQLDREQNGSGPDIVLLDLNLPRRSGAEVLERLRQSSTIGSIPVVILTSSDSQRDRATASRLGATKYFQKPSRLQEFMKLGPLVQELLNKKSTAV